MAWRLVAELIVLAHGGEIGLGTLAGPVAQETLTSPEAAYVLEDVDIRARRGAAKLTPMVEVDGAEIDAMGHWSIGEVLKQLDELYGGQGEAMVLINGQQVPLPSVFNGFPPDAAVRVEVLPPEAAGLYGGRAGQVVYNLVLQPRYASVDAGGLGSGPTQGGTYSLRSDVQRSSILGQNTHQIRVSLNYDRALEARDRQIEDAMGQAYDPRVTLRPQNLGLDLGAMATRSLGGWGVVMNLMGRMTQSESLSQYGLDLAQWRSEDQSLNLSVGASGQLLGWSTNINSSLMLRTSQEEGFSPSNSESQNLGLGVTLNRALMSLPAGQVTSNLGLNKRYSWMDMERDGQVTDYADQGQDARLSLNLPLVSPGEKGLGRLGRLQADVHYGWQASGSGSGEDVGLSLGWQPMTKVRLNASWSQSMTGVAAMRSKPISYGTPMTVYDFRRSEAVEVLPRLGGNPDLREPANQVVILSASIGPVTPWQVMLSVTYSQNEAEDGIGNLPDISEVVEAAFPERFVRDPSGRLIEVDYRPLNLSQSVAQNLTSSLYMAVPLAQILLGWSRSQDLVQMRLNYNRVLKSQTQLLPTLPLWDRMQGDGGGVEVHNLNGGVDVRLKDVTLSFTGNWQSGSRSRRLVGVDGPEDLLRSDLFMAGLKLSWQINRTAPVTHGEGVPRRRTTGSLLALEVNNLFDVRPDIRLGDGRPAPGYSRDRQDPIGRTVMLSLRQRF